MDLHLLLDPPLLAALEAARAKEGDGVADVDLLLETLMACERARKQAEARLRDIQQAHGAVVDQRNALRSRTTEVRQELRARLSRWVDPMKTADADAHWRAETQRENDREALECDRKVKVYVY